MAKKEEKKVITKKKAVKEVEAVEETIQEENILDDKGFALMYNITMVCGVATVAMFVLGTAIYLAAVS